jgi:Ferritin-like domain
VSAYLGAARLIDSKDYLTAAGSVLTIEARHSSYIRASLKQSPFPQAFDSPLSVNQVYSLASPFIKSCPLSNPPLPVRAFPALTLATTGPIKANSTIVLQTPGYVLSRPAASNSAQLYGAFITVIGPIFVKATPVAGGYSLVVPPGFNGQSYVVLTACDEKVSDATVAAGPAIIEISN